MSLLLDTHVFLWLAWDDPRLPEGIRAAACDAGASVFLSAASAWEIAIKHTAGRLPLPEPPDRLVPRVREALGLAPLPIDEESALAIARLPPLHRDPFDRILVAQAIVHGLVLATTDEQVRRYPVRSLG